MNVAIVVLDTLRKDAFDNHFNWLPGTRYENAWSTSHWTIPAHVALFTGSYASEVGTYARNMVLDTDEPVLAERLREDGYMTRAFSANVGVSPAFDFDRGFDQFELSRELELGTRNIYDWREFVLESRDRNAGPTRYARAVWECFAGDYETLPSLKRGLELKLNDVGIDAGTPDDGAQAVRDLVTSTDFGDREFFFCNLMEVHGPWNPPREYRTIEDYQMPDHPLGLDEENEVDPEPVRQAYADSVRYLSDIYEDIFAELAEAFDVIVTLADHGNLFGEHGVYGHTYGLYPEVTHVPLCVYDGREITETDDTMVSLFDVHRTVLEATDVDAPSRGRTLRADVEPVEILTEYHGITLDEKVETLRRHGVDEATIAEFDEWLEGIAVPERSYGYQTQDGFEVKGDHSAAELQAHLDGLVDSLNRVKRDDGEDIDDEVLDHLAYLGYA